LMKLLSTLSRYYFYRIFWLHDTKIPGISANYWLVRAMCFVKFYCITISYFIAAEYVEGTADCCIYPAFTDGIYTFKVFH